MTELFSIFLNVITPVFSLVVMGFVAGPRLNLEARTLSRAVYYLFIPAYVFRAVQLAQVDLTVVARMTLASTLTHLACAALGFGLARLLHRPREVTAAYMLIAIFGNVGNFGLPLLQFRFPNEPQAQTISTVYFLVILSISFMVGVAAANYAKGGALTAITAVFKIPALLAVPPALLVNVLGWELPPVLTRPLDLLGAAMIPVMIVSLGVQLAGSGRPKITLDVVLASLVRLIGGPVLALLLTAVFGLSGLEWSIGIVQAAMPTAVLASIIALENDLVPDFVITSVLFSTLLSLLTLTFVLSLV